MSATTRKRADDGSRAFWLSMTADVVGPLALFYVLRLGGVDQWLALVLSGAVPLARVVYEGVFHHRVGRAALFTLSMVVVATAVSFVTGDPRLLVARESYFTFVIGTWMMATFFFARPVIYTMMVRVVPEEQRPRWQAEWEDDPRFRRVLRTMTLAWGAALVLDAVARIVMAYTLPLDLVPLLGIVIAVVLLSGVVLASRAYAARAMPNSVLAGSADRGSDG